MNSEIRFEILNDEAENARLKNESQQAKEAIIANEAADAISFDRHPFWQKMKKDLEEVRDRIINRIVSDESMTKYQIDHYRLEVKNIKLFLDHPKMYVKRLKDLLALKRTRKGK